MNREVTKGYTTFYLKVHGGSLYKDARQFSESFLLRKSPLQTPLQGIV